MVCGPGHRQQQLLRRHGGEDLAEAAELHGNDDDGDERGDVDQDVLDDGDRCRRAQTARIGEGGQYHEGNEQRQIGRKSGAGNAERADHDLDADQLQGDVGHGRDDAGDGDRQRQPAIAEAPAHEITRRDVAVLVADVPEAPKDQEQEGIDDDGVGHGEERDRAGAERERGNRDEGVGGVQIAADQEPGDDGAEAPAAQAPFMQQIQIALAPVGGGEAQPGDEAEQQHEDRQRDPIQFCTYPLRLCSRLVQRPVISSVAKYTTAVNTALTMTHSS